MNKEKLKFTVAISAYNIENYIERAIESVLNQEFTDYEIIIVDDCSNDNTAKKIRQYADDRIRFFQTEQNTGTAGAGRNIAIDNAQGEYIIFLDGDDTLYDNKVLEKISNALGNEKPDILFLGYEDVGQGNKERISTEENSTKKARLICDVTFSVSSKCWNREFLLQNDMKFIEGMYYEDELYSLKATVLCKTTKYSNIKVFKYYRKREGSIMSAPSVKKCSDWYRMLAEVMDLYKITPDEYKPYLLSFIKNENESVPIRIANILRALENEEEIKILPKRNYKYREFFDEAN